MATNKPRYSITFDPELVEMLNEYWHTHRLKNKNAALNELLRIALNDRKAIASDEQHFLDAYRNAPPLAQKMTLAALDAAVEDKAATLDRVLPDSNPDRPISQDLIRSEIERVRPHPPDENEASL